MICQTYTENPQTDILISKFGTASGVATPDIVDKQTCYSQTCYIPTAEVQLCWDAVQLSRHDALMPAAVACACFGCAAHRCVTLFCDEH